MIDYGPMLVAAIAGFGLGGFFYGGLYFTITRGLESPHPALWFFSSLLLRTTLVLAGIYFISDGSWQRIVACMAGFMVAGVIVKVWNNTPPLILKAHDRVVKTPDRIATQSFSDPNEDSHYAP